MPRLQRAQSLSRHHWPVSTSLLLLIGTAILVNAVFPKAILSDFLNLGHGAQLMGIPAHHRLVTRRASEDVRGIAATSTAEEEPATLDEQAALTLDDKHPIFDTISLIDRYGGIEGLLNTHRKAMKDGHINQNYVDTVKTWLDFVDDLNSTAYKSRIDFEYDNGARLVLLGTNHLTADSVKLAVDTVREEKPDCLVLERSLGDDGLQRLTVPESLVQGRMMNEPPFEITPDDDGVERIAKFNEEKKWLETTPGWYGIGGPAAYAKEFGAAFMEFVRQRNDNEVQGGTLCFGDCDLRFAAARNMDERNMPIDIANLGSDLAEPVRDLQLAQSMRAAIRTHRRVVAIFGRAHLAGVVKLLKQDPRMTVSYEGVPIPEPAWAKDLKRGRQGLKRWERAAMQASGLWARLVESTEDAPFGTFMSAEAALELGALQTENAKRIKEHGLEKAEPVGALSSALADDFFKRGLAVTPEDEDQLRQWLKGEQIPDQEAGVFPFETKTKKVLRQAVPSNPSLAAV